MTELAGRLNRLSLRFRLVAGFSAVMLVLLVGAGTFVYSRVQFALDRALNTELVDSSTRLAQAVTSSGTVGDQSALLGGERYQVVDAEGHVLSQSMAGSTQALLSPDAVREATTQPVERDIGALLPGSSQPLRVYATKLPFEGPSGAAVLIVAAERNQHDEALRELLGQLLLAGLGTLLVTAVVGDRLARASLRPVERYRRQAASVTAGATGVQLDVPPGRDDEITRLGHTLNDMLQALATALEHERRFINDASHELRTPLTLIQTRVQLARRRRRTVDQHETVLDEIETDLQRLSHLADDLLTVGMNRKEEVAEPIDLSVVVRAEVERRQTLSAPNGVYRQTGALRTLTSGQIPVSLHRSRLEQLVGNVLDNAAVHGLPPVTVIADCAGDTARLVVMDVGAGMDATTLASAPDRFTRAAEARHRPGAGLGLSLVHAIVISAEGELRLCYQGRHESFGNPREITCNHGPEMTVTVLLPLSSSRRNPIGEEPPESDNP